MKDKTDYGERLKEDYKKMGYDLENRLERSDLSGWGRTPWSQKSYHL